MTVEDRLQGELKLKPELCTLNLGTMNYGSFPMIDRYRDKIRFAWEEPYLESTRAGERAGRLARLARRGVVWPRGV